MISLCIPDAEFLGTYRGLLRLELAFGPVGAGLFLRGVETISNPGLGMDITRVLWIRFYFLS
jgi:hypothetical protein